MAIDFKESIYTTVTKVSNLLSTRSVISIESSSKTTSSRPVNLIVLNAVWSVIITFSFWLLS